MTSLLPCIEFIGSHTNATLVSRLVYHHLLVYTIIDVYLNIVILGILMNSLCLLNSPALTVSEFPAHITLVPPTVAVV